MFWDNTNKRLGIGTTSPAQKLSVAGTIESTSGGVKFPDGTTQTTAASGGGASEGGAGCPTIGTITEPGTGSAGTACTDGSKFIGRYAGANYFATSSDDSSGTTWSSASTLCANLNRHGHTDWFLPSLAVLQMMYENRTQIAGFSAAYYWAAASDGNGDYGAWGINFINGNQYSGGSSFRARCARRT